MAACAGGDRIARLVEPVLGGGESRRRKPRRPRPAPGGAPGRCGRGRSRTGRWRAGRRAGRCRRPAPASWRPGRRRWRNSPRPALGLAELRLGLGEREPGVGGVDHHQHLAALDRHGCRWPAPAMTGPDDQRRDVGGVGVHIGVVGRDVMRADEQPVQAEAISATTTTTPPSRANRRPRVNPAARAPAAARGFGPASAAAVSLRASIGSLPVWVRRRRSRRPARGRARCRG